MNAARGVYVFDFTSPSPSNDAQPPRRSFILFLQPTFLSFSMTSRDYDDGFWLIPTQMDGASEDRSSGVEKSESAHVTDTPSPENHGKGLTVPHDDEADEGLPEATGSEQDRQAR